MKKILVVGAGKIGRAIVHLLASEPGYSVRIADVSREALAHFHDYPPQVSIFPLDGTTERLKLAMRGCDAVISALYHEHNPLVAYTALHSGLSYFDLTEDVASTQKIIQIGADAQPGQVFIPQCGLAPGFVSIVAGNLAGCFDKVDSIHLRVGALPQFPENKLKYNLTWSTDGLINEYCNPCDAIVAGEKIKVQPLDGVENFSIEGTQYEAFNTSGGLGNLCDTLGCAVRQMNYKTLRYPGHRDLMHFLLHDCKFIERREALKTLLENTLPATDQDVVVIYCTATGYINGKFAAVADVRRIYSRKPWSAIQITTASSVCALVDMHFEGQINRSGVVLRQEDIPLNDFLNNRFGRAYAK